MSLPTQTPTPVREENHPQPSVEAVVEQRLISDPPPFESYSKLQPIGGGGIAEIWLAEHPELPTPIALKIARAHLISNPYVHKQFERERQAARVLRHKYIVRAYYGGDADGTPYLVMEHVTGRPLSHFVGSPFQWTFLRAALLQLCDALAYMHDQNVLHQDLKPSNILIDYQNRRLKITDFGLARFEQAPSGTTTRNVLGTPSYMAPEQARGQLGWLGPHTDLYTVGVLLYELLTGAKPFTATNARVVMLQHCTTPVPEPVFSPGLTPPDGVRDILLRLLAKNPEARYDNAHELAHAIREL